MTTFSRRHLFLGSAATSLALALSACSSDSHLQESAQNLASALTNLDISGIQFANRDAAQAQKSLEHASYNMTGAEPTVSVAEVNQGGDSPRAKLHWAWKIPGSPQPWEYDSSVTFTAEGENMTPQWSPTVIHPDVEESAGLLLESKSASRGEILGQDDAAIVTSRPVVQVGIDKTKVSGNEAQQKSARALAELVDIDADAFAKQVKNAGESQFVEAIVLRQEAFNKINQSDIEKIEGFFSTESTRSLAPSADFAPDILGTVSPATSDDIEKSEGKLVSGQMIGHGGLSERFDEHLRGTDGYSIYSVQIKDDGSVDPEQFINRDNPLHQVDVSNGKNLNITLDSAAQSQAVKILEDQDSPSAIVAMRVSTGEILVAANGKASEGFSTALMSQYAPGSTFKIPTSLSLLRKGMKTGSIVNCSESVTVDGQTFKNASTYPADALGEQTLAVAVAQSSNTAFINKRDKVTQADLHDASAALGIGIEDDLGVPAFFGTVPTDASEVEHAASMIGQGKILVSPIAMAIVAASAYKGEVVKPVLVKEQQLGETKVSNTSLTQDESKQLKTLMRGVVAEGGLQNLKELTPDTAVGKTGTAEYGNDNPPKTHSWVMAVHEDIAVALVVEDGNLGSITGAPLALEMFQEFKK